MASLSSVFPIFCFVRILAISIGQCSGMLLIDFLDGAGRLVCVAPGLENSAQVLGKLQSNLSMPGTVRV